MPYTPPEPHQADLGLTQPLPSGAGLVLGGGEPAPPYAPPAHNAVHLVLADPLPSSADLVLGEVGDGPPEATTALASLAGQFALRGAVQAVQGFAAATVGRFALRGAVAAHYDNSVFRGLVTGIAAPHQPAAARHTANVAGWAPSAAKHAAKPLSFQEALAAAVDRGLAWSVPTAAGHAVGAGQQEAQPAHWATAAVHGNGQPAWVATREQWQAAQATGRGAMAAYGHGKPTHPTQRAPWGLRAKPAHTTTAAPHHRAAHAHRLTTPAPWDVARPVQSYGGPAWVVPVVPVVPQPVIVNLRLCQPLLAAPHLVLGVDPCADLPPGATLYILPARFYMAVHQIEAHLLPSLAPLPIFDVSLSADSGSFAWSFSASAPPDAFDALTPTGGLPTSIRITLDGLQWVFVVDSLQRTEQFGKRGTRISGRSATALVGSPYSRETARLGATARNAQQLAAAALDLTDVALDWGIDDWLVPAGAWSHSGTPLAAVQALAEAAGGYVNSHRSAPTLLVRHPYPTLPGGVIGGPWNWAGVAVPDVELAPSAIITSSIDRRDGPDVDGVYVSGTAQGVLAHVKRTGTAGAKLSNMISDPLITANIAAQQRGLSVLGAAGAKHLVQISLPVLTGASQPGVLDVGQLVQINESAPWRGRVRSVSVQAAQPKVRQTITLERHLT